MFAPTAFSHNLQFFSKAISVVFLIIMFKQREQVEGNKLPLFAQHWKHQCCTLKGKAAVILRYQSAGEIAFHCCDKGRRRRRKEELGEDILAGQPTRSTPPFALPLYSFEWGTPLHFSSLLSGACVWGQSWRKACARSKVALWTCHSPLWDPDQAAGQDLT